jgi:hypothetical protein
MVLLVVEVRPLLEQIVQVQLEVQVELVQQLQLLDLQYKELVVEVEPYLVQVVQLVQVELL